MNKKRLLFVIGKLEMNGASASLLALLRVLAEDARYDLNLFLFSCPEETRIKIPPSVRVIQGDDYFHAWREPLRPIVVDALKRLRLGVALFRMIVALERILKINLGASSFLRPISGLWDVAIAYTDGFMAQFVADKVYARRKFAWIHCDYTKYPQSEEVYEAFDKVDGAVSVSWDSIEQFKKAIGREYKKPLYVVHNIIDAEDCRKRAESGSAPEFSGGGAQRFFASEESATRRDLI